MARVKGIEIACESAAELPPIAIDTERIEQAVDNLLENAVKYTPKGGAVRVRLDRTESHARVSIADTGPGLDPEKAARLFAPFQTAGSKTTGGESATGLGLAIVKAIAEEHGGGVRLENRPGQGAAFVLELPLGRAGSESGLQKNAAG
jgi:two-component system OmpR family sensor kinase